LWGVWVEIRMAGTESLERKVVAVGILLLDLF
jgi:hypothetical protein